jgi:TonB family protein
MNLMRSLLLLAVALTLGLQTDASGQDGVGPGPRVGGGDHCKAPGPTEREDDGKVYTGREVTCKAVILSRPAPEYPEGARLSDMRQGTVILRAVLLASGKVGEVTVVRSSNRRVSSAAVEAARLIKFRPAIKDDRWVSQRVTLQYEFNTN